jgi:hypothetical protein
MAVTGFQLLDATGATVPCFELDSSNDPNKIYIWSNQAFLVPKAALTLGSHYTAEFSGTVNGASVQKTWTFSTPAATLRPISVGPYVLHNGASVSIRVAAPSGETAFGYSWTAPALGSTLHASVSMDAITLSLDANAVSAPTTVTVTATDLGYPTVPAQTFTVTAEP